MIVILLCIVRCVHVLTYDALPAGRAVLARSNMYRSRWLPQRALGERVFDDVPVRTSCVAKTNRGTVCIGDTVVVKARSTLLRPTPPPLHSTLLHSCSAHLHSSAPPSAGLSRPSARASGARGRAPAEWRAAPPCPRPLGSRAPRRRRHARRARPRPRQAPRAAAHRSRPSGDDADDDDDDDDDDMRALLVSLRRGRRRRRRPPRPRPR